MSYFTDLTRYTYTNVGGDIILNVGWLDIDHPFPKGNTTAEFRRLLGKLCQSPMLLHFGFHVCQFCPKKTVCSATHPERRGNGQIRVMDLGGIWYAAPTMIYHYVSQHSYLPPDQFIEAVLKPFEIGRDQAVEGD